MHRFILSLSCFLMLFAAPISAQDFEKGLEAAQSGDFETALKKWAPLADAGDSSAQFNVALLYGNGWGVPQDYKEVVKWYILATEQGDAAAQFNLGNMYNKGQGVLADFIIAHMWSNIAAANGNEPGAENRELIAKNMTPEDISQAQTMAKVCMNSNYEKCGY